MDLLHDSSAQACLIRGFIGLALAPVATYLVMVVLCVLAFLIGVVQGFWREISVWWYWKKFCREMSDSICKDD